MGWDVACNVPTEFDVGEKDTKFHNEIQIPPIVPLTPVTYVIDEEKNFQMDYGRIVTGRIQS